MLKWAADLNINIDRETWEEIWQAASETSLCTTIKENIYKILFGWYLTPARLNQIYPQASDLCWRGCGHRGERMVHIWWTCPEIVKYWAKVQILIKEVTDLELPIEPLTYLLAAPMSDIVRPTRKLISFILTAARCCVAASWRKTTTPAMGTIEKRVGEVLIMERLTATVRQKLQAHEDIWEPWSSRYRPGGPTPGRRRVTPSP
ncbi:hypothetical protein FKM82_031308 [Ascaphus truei]